MQGQNDGMGSVDQEMPQKGCTASPSGDVQDGKQGELLPTPDPQPSHGQLHNEGSASMRSIGVTAVLAILLAGLGHIYLGRTGIGVAVLVLYIVLWVVGGVVAMFTFGLGFLIPIVFLIWQVYDAYKLVGRYNIALQQTGRPPW